jgi:V8-like Glu-specific endopeptidase
MKPTEAIRQASQRAGPNYTRKRDTPDFEESIKNWREKEKPERVMRRLAAVSLAGEALKMEAAISGNEPSEAFNPLERIIGTSQLISSIYLSLGAHRMRAVGRIMTEGKQGFGTGFMISPSLLMTNNHVLETASMAARCLVQFDYVRAIDGKIGLTEIYQLEPDRFFLTSTEKDLNLDYTIVAVEPVNSDGKQLANRGYIPLISVSGKVVLGDLVNIIQHPGGEPQQVALRDSKVTDPMESFLRYEADTQPGSSGSPVFNDFWQVAALHHSGVPEEVRKGVYRLIDGGEWDTTQHLPHDEQVRMEARVKWIANEGVRISKIVSDVQERLKNEAAKLAMFNEAVREDLRPVGEADLPEGVATPAVPRTLTVDSALAAAMQSLAANVGTTVTWTVPLRVTVQLGPEIQLAAQPALSPAINIPGRPQSLSVEAAAERVRASLAGKREILEVREGFFWQDGEMTNEQAVVVVLDPQSTMTSPDAYDALQIPKTVGGVRVDVTVGGASAVFRARERSSTGPAEAMSLDILAQEKVPTIGYKPPDDVTLDEVEEPMEVTCHSSPDDGWPVLKEFLSRVRRTLTVGMFDLTAPHIVATFRQMANKRNFRVNLAIQMGMAGGLKGEKKNDIPEDEFIDEMKQAMGRRFRQAYVDVSGDDRTFASAYHIKVAVRDHEEFWLSSGNMQTSNQPDISPAADDEKTFGPLRRFNREWHTVIKNKKLATIFEKFLLHDLETAEENPAETPQATDEALLPVESIDPEFLEAGKKAQYFDRQIFPKRTGDPVKIQPLLTPDNYLENVIPIVESAKKTLFIQNQSLSLLYPNDKNEDEFIRLFDAIRKRQDAGVDVRMIFRVITANEDGARETKDNLVRFGLDKQRILVQENCHTKGVIVDSKVVILGSHNWTNQGSIANRDASLILHHPGIAEFYEKLFLFDWENRTREPRIKKSTKRGPGEHEAGIRVHTEQVKVRADELELGG